MVCVCGGGGYNCTLGSIAVHLNNIYILKHPTKRPAICCSSILSNIFWPD